MVARALLADGEVRTSQSVVPSTRVERFAG
jgi:hypothetical protein